ncbi:hypothetical protein Bpfe_025921, partial [Biomphalaria pfeifferi]
KLFNQPTEVSPTTPILPRLKSLQRWSQKECSAPSQEVVISVVHTCTARHGRLMSPPTKAELLFNKGNTRL